MSYIPHAVIGASAGLYGSVSSSDILIADSRSDTQSAFPIYLEITLVNVPGGRTLHGVRFYGRLDLTFTIPGATGTGAVYSGSAYQTFDELLRDARTQVKARGKNSSGGSLSEAEAWEVVRSGVRAALNGTLVSPIKVGGRWIVR